MGIIVPLDVGVGSRIPPVPLRAVKVDARDQLRYVSPFEEGVVLTARVELVHGCGRTLRDVDVAVELAVAARDVGERLVERMRRARRITVGDLPRVGDV